jgi:PAS domain S-box-containing protein
MTLPDGLTEKGEGAVRASLELLYHVSREFAAALDLRAVLERVLILSMQTVGAMSGSLIVLDDHGKAVESAIVTGTEVHNHTTLRLRATLERGLSGWVVRHKQAVLIDDTTKDDRWLPRRYDSETETQPKSAVCAPLMVRDRLVGVMTLAHGVPGTFTPEHLALVQAIADQAGIAVLNARLYEESQRQARVMSALAESAAAITASLNLEDVLVRILEQISQLLRVQAVSLALLDAGKNELVFRAAIGWKEKENLRLHLKTGQGLVGWVAREGRGVVVPDVHEDGRFDPEVNTRTGIEVSAAACAPIRTRGQVIGVLEALNPSEGTFNADALLVLTGIGSLAGTAIRHAQLFERLQAAHQRYRELFEDSIDPILITDWEGRVIEANRQASLMIDLDKDSLRGKAIGDLHTIDATEVGNHFERLAEGGTLSYESTIQAPSGKSVPVQVYVRQVQIEEAPYIQWIVRDISERKNLDSLREDLLSMIYHDLQSPLANVVSSLDIVDTMLPTNNDSTLKSLISIAVRSAGRIQRLTNSLLDINRLEAGQPIGNRQPNNLAALASDAMDSTLPILQSKRQSLENEIPPDLPRVFVDADMIRRTMANLIENAVKYSPPDSQIQIGARQDGGMVEVWVQDYGPGISPADHERIFEKFTRLQAREIPKGLGLGLAYCRMIINAHGGRIWVDSDIGKGARFTFTLPVADEPTQ